MRHPHAGNGRVTGAHGLTVRVQALNVADERLKHAQTLGARHAYGSSGGAGGKPQGTHGTGCPQYRLGAGVTRQGVDEGSGGGSVQAVHGAHAG